MQGTGLGQAAGAEASPLRRRQNPSESPPDSILHPSYSFTFTNFSVVRSPCPTETTLETPGASSLHGQCVRRTFGADVYGFLGPFLAVPSPLALRSPLISPWVILNDAGGALYVAPRFLVVKPELTRLGLTIGGLQRHGSCGRRNLARRQGSSKLA